MPDWIEVCAGNKESEHVSLKKVTRTGRENWFNVEIDIRCDGWHGTIRANFMQGELTRFGEEIRHLHRRLSGEAKLEPLEPHLVLSLAGDGKGHILVCGEARNHFESGTVLSFQFEIDQTYLPSLADGLLELDRNL